MATSLARLLPELRACTHCEPALPLGAKPIFQLDHRAPILIASQAPGRIAHEKGRPFDDASGDRLRAWLGVSRETFYDPACFAIFPMGLCFPGKAASGDLPPRPECAPLWRRQVLDALPHIRLTLAIGQYALSWHLQRKASVDEAVTGWREGLARGLLPLPHPSPRNQNWLKRRPWFEAEVLPALRLAVAQALTGPSPRAPA
ncbi:uracil-DNA glycosylase family protein [Roseateles sp. NT4]|uniref:uracil-DNA glycosylase family protein n=1 Tax=Roseateles sp. NT4 TaxID=3453715 RepID=UPI003EE9080C